jgi:hypothetical protein
LNNSETMAAVALPSAEDDEVATGERKNGRDLS